MSHIDAETVWQFIRARKNRRYTIWSAGTTLERMKIEQFPHHPPDRYQEMQQVLKMLESNGLLVRRPRRHKHYSMTELAYELAQPNS